MLYTPCSSRGNIVGSQDSSVRLVHICNIYYDKPLVFRTFPCEMGSFSVVLVDTFKSRITYQAVDYL